MGRLYTIRLDGKIYSCRYCLNPLAYCQDIMSKTFHCKQGKAYLFSNAENVTVGPKEQRLMTTGTHIVCDIFCNSCNQIVGWKYELAYEKSQKYKEGKFILERARIIAVDGGGVHMETDTDEF